MFDEHSFQLLNEVLRGVAYVVAIIGGTVATLYHLRKLAPGWHRHVFPLLAALSPALFSAAGMVALAWKYYLLAGGVFTLGFLVEVIRFIRDAAPLDRKAVMWFGISCCSFVLALPASPRPDSTLDGGFSFSRCFPGSGV
jgi:hypothetical protein